MRNIGFASDKQALSGSRGIDYQCTALYIETVFKSSIKDIHELQVEFGIVGCFVMLSRQ